MNVFTNPDRRSGEGWCITRRGEHEATPHPHPPPHPSIHTSVHTFPSQAALERVALYHHELNPDKSRLLAFWRARELTHSRLRKKDTGKAIIRATVSWAAQPSF